MSDKWTDPTVAIYLGKHYTRIGIWTSVALSRKTVTHLQLIIFSLDFKSIFSAQMEINDEDIMTSVVSRKVCAHRNDHERYHHLVPGFGNYTEENCNFAVRQKRVTEYANCYMMNLPYKGLDKYRVAFF